MPIELILSKKLLKLEVADWILLIMVVTYSTIFSFYTIMRFYSFRVSAWDLGTLVQSLSSASRGHNFVNNVEIYFSPTGSYLGLHFSPILFTLIPIFYMIPKTETVIILHTIILALTCIPLYLIAKHCFGKRIPALALSSTCLINPLLQGLNWCDFTPQTFFPALILSATYFLKKRKPAYFLIFLGLSLLTMEQASYFVIFFIPYIAWELRKDFRGQSNLKKIHKVLPLIILILTITWVLFSSSIKHAINPNPPEEIYATANFRVLGVKSIAEIPAKAFTDPNSLLKAFNYDMPKKTFYILITFASSCFLALLSPLPLLPSLLWLFLASISNWPPYYQLGFQYTAFTMPFVMIATIESIDKLRKSVDTESAAKLLNRISLLLLCTGLVISAFTSPLSPVHKPGDFTYFKDYGIICPSKLDFTVREVLSQLPSDAKILTTPNLFPHIATNVNAYVIPPLNAPSEKLYRQTLSYLQKIKVDYVVIAYYYFDKIDAEALYDEFVAGQSNYALLIYAPGLEVFKKNYEGSPTMLSARFTYKELYTTDGLIVDDATSESGKVIKFTSSQTSKTAWFGPYICLEPGNYTVKFKLKTDAAGGDEKIIRLDAYSNSLQKEIASIEIYGKNITKASTWQTFTFQLNLPNRIADVEFRGVEVANGTTVFLDYIEVKPIILFKPSS
jgi:uncharacterized membrane protein